MTNRTFNIRKCFIAFAICTFLINYFNASTAAAEKPKSGALLLAGGGKLPEVVWNRFVKLAGGEEAHLVVIPTATADENIPTQEALASRWKERGIDNVTLLHTRDKQKANTPAFVKPLQQATAVWIGGGDQSRLADVYAGTAVERELSAMIKRGGIVGGTSAGAAICSRVMIAGGKDVPNIGRGFDLVPKVIFDQHFLRRNRMERLQHAVRQHPYCTGIGIDESTALLIHDRKATVLGKSYVVKINSPGNGKPLNTIIYRSGDELDPPVAQEQIERKEWAIVLHGGAGNFPKDAPKELVQAYRDGLRAALDAGKKKLEQGDSSLEAVEVVILKLEDNPLFNAGKGAVFNSEGKHELDASIMDGKTLDAGGVAGVKTVKNPIALARRVMGETRHVLLAGQGAEAFATEQKVERVENIYFATKTKRDAWERMKAKLQNKTTSQSSQSNKKLPEGETLAKSWKYGTVGCVALDKNGNIAAGTSTGGLTNKKFGRVGDSPIIGAGTYADNATCGVSATGIGEQFIRHTVAAQISQLMREHGWTLKQSARYVLHRRLNKEDGGVVCLDKNGTIEWVYTTPHMFRAAADATGRFDVFIRDEE